MFFQINWHAALNSSPYIELARNIKAKDDTWYFSGPQDEKIIEEVEAKYNLVFPNSYKLFLHQVGMLEYADHHYSGLDEQYLDPVCGIMRSTHIQQEENNLPSGLFCLEENHDAHELACFNLNELIDGECPVVWFNVYSSKIIGKCAENFDAFIRARLEPWLQDT